MPDPGGSERDVEGAEAPDLAEIASRQGMQALVTRPHEEAQSLAAALTVREVGAVIEPMMEVHYCGAAALDLATVQAILCTSANGVRALARVTGERRLPLLAVGETTASRARAEGFTAVAAPAALPQTSSASRRHDCARRMDGCCMWPAISSPVISSANCGRTAL